MRLGLALGLALALPVGLASCGGRIGPDAGGADAPDAMTAPGLYLSPAEATLVSVEGAMTELELEAHVVHADGSRERVDVARVVVSDDRVLSPVVGLRFVATGRAGGLVTVTAHYADAELGELTASAAVTVRVVHVVVPGPEIPSTIWDDFLLLPETEDPFASAAIEYPLDGARMPNNVAAPVVQWYPRGGMGDGYRVVISSPYVEVTAYGYDDGLRFRHAHAIDAASWQLVTGSTRGSEVSVRVDRLPAGGDAILRGPPISIWLSEDGVFGSLYYWQVETDPQTSDVLRLDAATGERTSVMSPAPGRCVGCHALTPDGRRMAATMDGRALRWVTAIVDLTSDTSPAPDLTPPIDPGYHFLAFSPDGRRALASLPTGLGRDDTALALVDGATGIAVEATGLPEGSAGYPAWSPDGAHVAWMGGGGDGPSGTIQPTRIVVADVTGDALGAPRTLHDGAVLSGAIEGGATDSRPTWSPDSAWLAFAHGTSSVSSATDEAPPRAGLYLVPAAGGAPVRLSRGMGREGPVDAFWPVFSPFVTEERDGTRLFWLAFYSRADYGNDREGTDGTGRRQLWVMAIDPSRVAAGEDPSYVPYWLPGQDTRADDIAALWVQTGCRGRDEHCSSSSECCSGECAPNGDGELVCQPPTECREPGESCEQPSDCCSGICALGICDYESPF